MWLVLRFHWLGQPNDAFHQWLHKFRKGYERVVVGWKSNILLRDTFEDMYKDEYGADGAKMTVTDMLKADLYAWRSISESIVRWGWRHS